MHRLLRRVEARQREASLTGGALVVTLVVVLLLALGNVDSSQSAERPRRRHHLKSQWRRLLPYPLRTADAQPEILSDFSFFYLTSGCTWNATKVSYQRLTLNPPSTFSKTAVLGQNAACCASAKRRRSALWSRQECATDTSGRSRGALVQGSMLAPLPCWRTFSPTLSEQRATPAFSF